MEYEIKVNISKGDYFAFQKEYLMNSKIIKISLILLSCLLLFVLFFDIILKVQFSKILSDILPIIIILLVYSICLPLIYKRIYNSDKTIQEEQTLLLKEDGIHHSMQRGSFNYTLEDFYRVIFGKKLISIFVSKQKALLLPRHCFSSKEEEQAVEAFIKAHYVKAKKAK